MFRNFQGTIGASGSGSMDIIQPNAVVEWDIYQISCQCGTLQGGCFVTLFVNGFFLCATPQGSRDTATGPPDVVLGHSDTLTAQWTNGIPNDPINVGLWYNEYPAGTTIANIAMGFVPMAPRRA